MDPSGDLTLVVLTAWATAEGVEAFTTLQQLQLRALFLMHQCKANIQGGVNHQAAVSLVSNTQKVLTPIIGLQDNDELRWTDFLPLAHVMAVLSSVPDETGPAP